MTQSGQGQEPHLPAARPAHEGVVLPAEGGAAWSDPAAAGPAGGRPWGGPWGPPDGQQHQPHQPQPGAYPSYPQEYPYPQQGQPGQPGQYGTQPQQPHQHQPQQPHQHQAHQQHQHQQAHEQHRPQQPHPSQYGTVAQPLPPEAPRGTAPGSASDADATQYIAPVAGGPGPMPPTGADAEATQYLPPVPPQPSGAPFGIRPGTPDERQPPAEFDNLFRNDAAATQHMPQYGTPPEPVRPQSEERVAAGRRSSKVTLIAAVVIGCTVVGLGAGALLSAGGDDPGTKADHTSVAAATSPTPPGDGATQAPDPAKPQAEELDKLLAQSSDSRDAVIRSVENIKRCDNLDQAASDLRSAATQRRGLVTRLQGLQVDKLPDNAALTAALTKAWQASASADDHYAAWATQVKGKKGCKDGKARHTNHTALANRASGEATAAKREAGGLWNKIAGTYGLTPRQPEQL
ncbi:hypothetical protein [Streptomyces sp. NPDC006368]|uniref:hypothetical protein n=1 Tax=Streptomyces sp. NPDC006368 TaxID=3156760 RepID=UPI0033A86A9C